MNKRITLLLLTLCFGGVLSAQIIKGDQFLTLQGPGGFSVLSAPNPIAGNIGGLYALNEGEGVVLVLSPQYGFAVSDDIVVGTGLGIASVIASGGGTGGMLTPYGRYYFVNRPSLLAFAELGVGFNFGEVLNTSTTLLPSAGISLPFGDNILFSPQLNYQIREGSNVVGLNWQFEFRLGRNNQGTGKAVGEFAKGSWMFGTLVGGISFVNNGGTRVQISPEAHYFLSNRLALGLGITTNQFSREGFSVGSTAFTPNLRVFFKDPKHTNLFLQLGLAYQTENASFTPLSDGSTISLDGGLGLLIFLRERIALETGLGFRVIPEAELFEVGLNLGARFVLPGS